MKPLPTHQSPLSSPLQGGGYDHDMDSLSDQGDDRFEDDLSHNGRSPTPLEDDGGSDSSAEYGGKSDSVWSRMRKSQLMAQVPAVVLCYWCKRLCEDKGPEEAQGTRDTFPLTSGDKHFCSEVCFTQSRRASFKKAKVCDWCHQIKPTVSYVSFIDGKNQLQFCSNSCLNQYKMHIFCRETEAHLQLHPHLSNLRASQEDTLITPDLWLKDCSNEDNKPFSRSKDLESDERDIENGHAGVSTGPPMSSGSSTRETSPLPYDINEPVNLCVTNKEFQTSARLSERKNNFHVESKKLQLPRQAVQSFKVSQPRERTGCSRKVPKESSKGKIRVRQLEERRGSLVSETNTSTTHSTASASPSASTSMAGIHPGLGNLLLNGQNPFLPNIQNIIPPSPMDFSHHHPHILPQLLLSPPDYLKFPGIRPPFPLPSTPLPQMPPVQPPFTVNKPMGSQVTVLLPTPVPVPIPIPVPVPFPVPINEFNAIKKKLEETQARNEQTEECINSPSPDRKFIAESEVNHVKSRSPTPVLQNRINAASASKEMVPSFGKMSNEDLTDKETKVLPLLTAKDHNLIPKRKERRSILQYTSDVYEINGVFVPKGGTWIGNGGASSLTRNRKEKGFNSTKCTNGSPDKVEPGAFCENKRIVRNVTCKRSSEPTNLSNDQHDSSAEPLPKKKHLIV